MPNDLATGPPLAAAAGDQRAKREPVDSALAYYDGLKAEDADSFLARIRPPGLAEPLRAQAKSSRSKEDQLLPTGKDLRKLAVIDPILRYHDRLGVIEIALIDAPYAVMGLYARTQILISRGALDEIDPRELQAVAAHELGHEYFWDEYEKAGFERDEDRVRELELRCDGIAVLTLRRLGLDPRHLTDALTHLTWYNERKGARLTTGPYPSLSQRARFVHALTRSFAPAVRGRSTGPLIRQR
jgi:hypothetical protein